MQRATEEPPEQTVLFEFMARVPLDREPPPHMLAELGQVALLTKTIPEATFVARFAGMFGESAAWPERFACTAVNVRDGAFKMWTRVDGVALERAVASSCSVPAVFPPIALGDSLWMDGGVRSWTNADCAAGHRRVIVLAVVVPEQPARVTPALERELAAIESAGGTAALVVPDAQGLAVFGPNLLDARRSEAVIEAGIAQGRSEAARLKALWD
jgi:NTE family protein